MFLKKSTTQSTETYLAKMNRVRELIEDAESIVIGAGAGLSAAAGLLYSGERFKNLMPEFIEKYNLSDMYSAAFYPHKTLEEHWGYWSRHIYHNRYTAEIDSTYENLFNLVKDKNYFVITTNADHLFLLNSFEKSRLFYTQGDYGLYQCSVPCHKETYNNRDSIFEMVEKQKDLKIPTELIPYCPKCGETMTVNLRVDSTFVESEGWHLADERYQSFLKKNLGKKILFLELGIGYNTPGIIKYPFWQMTYTSKNANYVCINLDETSLPKEIEKKGIIINGDISKVMSDLKG